MPPEYNVVTTSFWQWLCYKWTSPLSGRHTYSYQQPRDSAPTSWQRSTTATDLSYMLCWIPLTTSPTKPTETCAICLACRNQIRWQARVDNYWSHGQRNRLDRFECDMWMLWEDGTVCNPNTLGNLSTTSERLAYITWVIYETKEHVLQWLSLKKVRWFVSSAQRARLILHG